MKIKYVVIGFTITVFLFIVIALFGARQYRVQDNDGNVVWAIASTGADTSRVYATNPTMTLFYWTADTSGDDSVDLDLSFQVYGSYGWLTAKTLTVTTDSTNSYWMITNTAVPSRNIWRLVVTGSADNKKASSVLGRFTYDAGN